MSLEKPKPLKGVCSFHSETGTEGGYWAFQDSLFITPNTTFFHCSKCYKFWDKGQYPDGPPVVGSEPIVVDRSIPLGEADSFDESGNVKIPPQCPPDDHDFELTSKSLWSYEGLHILEDGDQLIVFSRDNSDTIVWSGTIKLRHYPVFTEDAFGLWIHSDQENVDRETWARWFLKEHPAKLTPTS